MYRVRPLGAAVGRWKSILDGGYSGPSSHIFLDMNLCLRSTCLRLSPFASPSSSPSSFFLPPPPRVSPLHTIQHTHTPSCSRPPSPCLRSLLTARVFAPSRHLHSLPPVPLQKPRLFSFFGILIPFSPVERTITVA